MRVMTFTPLEGGLDPRPDYPSRPGSRSARLNGLRAYLRSLTYVHRLRRMQVDCSEREALAHLTRANYLEGRIALLEEALRQEAWPTPAR